MSEKKEKMSHLFIRTADLCLTHSTFFITHRSLSKQNNRSLCPIPCSLFSQIS